MSKHWKVKALQLANTGLSWRKIAKELGVARSTVSDHLRVNYITNLKAPVEGMGVLYGVGDTLVAVQGKTSHKSSETFSVHKKDDQEVDNSCILIISDLHIPYHHQDALDFLQYLKDKYSPTRVICLGDELDKHALSYHDSDPDLPSAGDELRRSLPVISKLHEMFPVMDIIESNHGSLVWRKAKTNGIPKHYIKSYNEVLGVGSGWKWSFDLTITLPNGKQCYIHHGKTTNIIQLSQQMGMCAVQGHYHESFKIDYWGNPNGLFWGMQSGCLIDDDSLAFNYNNVNIKRPVIGTGLIIDSLPVLEPLVMDKGGRWIKKAVQTVV